MPEQIVVERRFVELRRIERAQATGTRSMAPARTRRPAAGAMTPAFMPADRLENDELIPSSDAR